MGLLRALLLSTGLMDFINSTGLASGTTTSSSITVAAAAAVAVAAVVAPGVIARSVLEVPLPLSTFTFRVACLSAIITRTFEPLFPVSGAVATAKGVDISQLSQLWHLALVPALEQRDGGFRGVGCLESRLESLRIGLGDLHGDVVVSEVGDEVVDEVQIHIPVVDVGKSSLVKGPQSRVELEAGFVVLLPCGVEVCPGVLTTRRGDEEGFNLVKKSSKGLFYGSIDPVDGIERLPLHAGAERPPGLVVAPSVNMHAVLIGLAKI